MGGMSKLFQGVSVLGSMSAAHDMGGCVRFAPPCTTLCRFVHVPIMHTIGTTMSVLYDLVMVRSKVQRLSVLFGHGRPEVDMSVMHWMSVTAYVPAYVNPV